MLTVKHVKPDGGTAIMEATGVDSMPSLTSITKQQVYVAIPGEAVTRYLPGPGTVYVMNEAGQTVAKYELDGFDPREPAAE